MTAIRNSPSGKRINVAGEAAFAQRYRPAAILPLDEGTTNIVDSVIPLPADAEGPRLALVTVALAFANSDGFGGAPIYCPIGLLRNADVPINLGAARCAPTGPGVTTDGTPYFWTTANTLIVQPGDVFTLFASSIDAGGGVGSAASVLPFPLEQDAASVLTFLFP